MGHVALYRKYRPRTFSEVVGQDHAKAALVNAVRSGSLHHAYLLAGPRGTGKTTLARIVATAVNAPGGPDPDFDPDAEFATSIRRGHLDVVELDMASHGGVEDARDLRDQARMPPVEFRKRVYILDEVHMASPSAFNALLKLVEEPPDHVMFLMATTDPQKIIPTILSRVQRLDLRRVSADEVAGLIRRIGDAEGFALEDAAMASVLRAGDGSVRDTLSVLEQVLSVCGANVTAAAAAAVLGGTPLELSVAVVDAVGAGAAGRAFEIVGAAARNGLDASVFAQDVAAHARDVLVSASTGHTRLLVGSSAHVDAVVDQAGRVPQSVLLDLVNRLDGVTAARRRGTSARVALEMALANAASAVQALPDHAREAAVVPEVPDVERASAAAVPSPVPAPPRPEAQPDPQPQPAAASSPAPPTEPVPEPAAVDDDRNPFDFDDPSPATPTAPAAEPAAEAEPVPHPEPEPDAGGDPFAAVEESLTLLDAERIDDR